MTDMFQIEMYLINFSDKLSKEEIEEIMNNAFETNSLSAMIKIGDTQCKDVGELPNDSKFYFSNTDIEEYRKEFERNVKN